MGNRLTGVGAFLHPINPIHLFFLHFPILSCRIGDWHTFIDRSRLYR